MCGLRALVPAVWWLGKSYGYAADSRLSAGGCAGGTKTDTEQRAALFDTKIGDICVVTIDYEADATDLTWVDSVTGCGAGHPTIHVGHENGIAAIGRVGNGEVFMGVEGHWTTTPYLTASLTTNVDARDVADVYINFQELAKNDGSTYQSVHTGLGWWGLMSARCHCQQDYDSAER